MFLLREASHFGIMLMLMLKPNQHRGHTCKAPVPAILGTPAADPPPRHRDVGFAGTIFREPLAHPPNKLLLNNGENKCNEPRTAQPRNIKTSCRP